MSLINRLIKAFSKPQLEREAFTAYLQRLPDTLQVRWTRDDGYIIAEVQEGGRTYKTQARSGDEFIDMVNDVVFTMYDIPEKYRDPMHRFRAYKPSAETLAKLEDEGIRTSTATVEKLKAA